MFLPFGVQDILWQSGDGRMQAGVLRLGEQAAYFTALGERPLTLEDLRGLAAFLENELAEPWPLVLAAACPGFESTSESEAEGLILWAGRVRHLLQAQRQAGRPMLSVLETISVGGVYLMHGMAANVRAAVAGTVFHDTVPARPPVSLADALSYGLIDEILPQAHLTAWMTETLSRWAEAPAS